MPEPTIRVNDDWLPWSPGDHVAGVLDRIGAQPLAVATAVNGTFVARAERARTLLQPGDTLTVFKAIVGG
jgi:sulfur carrier protein